MKGRPAASLKDEARKCAEQMGYRWLENTDADVQFDGLMYRHTVTIAVKLKKIRYGLDENCIIENKFPENVADLRTLPFPQYVLRELWVRTQNERAWRRFIILPDATAEIEINTAEKYRNTHFREEYWKKAPYRMDIFLDKGGLGRDEV